MPTISRSRGKRPITADEKILTAYSVGSVRPVIICRLAGLTTGLPDLHCLPSSFMAGATKHPAGKIFRMGLSHDADLEPVVDLVDLEFHTGRRHIRHPGQLPDH